MEDESVFSDESSPRPAANSDTRLTKHGLRLFGQHHTFSFFFSVCAGVSWIEMGSELVLNLSDPQARNKMTVNATYFNVLWIFVNRSYWLKMFSAITVTLWESTASLPLSMRKKWRLSRLVVGDRYHCEMSARGVNVQLKALRTSRWRLALDDCCCKTK